MMMNQTTPPPFNHIDSDILDALDYQSQTEDFPTAFLDRDIFNDAFADDSESYAASVTDDVDIMNLLADLWLDRGYDLYLETRNDY